MQCYLYCLGFGTYASEKSLFMAIRKFIVSSQSLCNAMAFVSFAWELLAVFCLFSSSPLTVLSVALIGVKFHLGVAVTMGIDFIVYWCVSFAAFAPEAMAVFSGQPSIVASVQRLPLLHGGDFA